MLIRFFEATEERRDEANKLVPSKVLKLELKKLIDGTEHIFDRDATEEDKANFKSEFAAFQQAKQLLEVEG